MATFSAAHAMKKKIARKMLKKTGIHGIGVGYHDPKNPKKGGAVIIYSDSISATARGIPSKYSITTKGKKKGKAQGKTQEKTVTVPIRIVKTKKFRSHADYKSRIRPIPAGYSTGTTSGSGTIGLIVTNYPNPRQRYIFSNNHVLNPSNSIAYTETLQPGGADKGQTGKDRVGRLYRFAKLSQNQNNLVDAALAIPLSRPLLNPRYATVGVIPGHVTSYRIGDRFKKVGRTTGQVSGVVDSVHTDIQVDYENLGSVQFLNQTVIKGTSPVSLAGDSGSVWLRQQDNYAAAVNFAGSSDGRLSISYPIQWFMKKFGTRVAQPRGVGRVKTIKRNVKDAYTSQLTAKQLASIQTFKAKIRP
ncbi:hypothetical protein J2Z66_003142 [Paenibacillus eucommiae]|uniref:Uncharacterized protein n=1 Tax=Paenibacillus eucommiae TaxID=1355755 RepID=A0ABS4IVC5_9BACL|nr:hypothetical protein [Paenibacillus eucommiae]